MEIAEHKSALRRFVIARVLAMDDSERTAQQGALHELFRRLPCYDLARIVLLYVSALPEEFDTEPLLRDALGRGKRVVCPRVDRGSRRLVLHQINDPTSEFVPGPLGIPEPRPSCREIAPGDIDWALVPGVAFDARCFRLGRGAGHYDKLLPLLRPDAPRWALAFDAQWIDALPTEPHDQPLSGVRSPSRGARRVAEKNARFGTESV